MKGPHCTGKAGKMAQKNPCQGNTENLENLPKHRGILCAQVHNSLILKIKILQICSEIFPRELTMSAKSVLQIKHPPITKIGTGKSCGQTGKRQGI